jgi:lysozyme
MTLTGPDISNWQGNAIDWDAIVAQGASFAFCKASEGVNYADPTLPRNWVETKRVGLLRGAYHFARPDQGTSAEAEADFFLRQIQHSLDPSDMVVLDIEVGNGDLSAWCLTWLRHVEAALGFKPIVYTGGWFAPGRLVDPALGAYKLWNSAYVLVSPPAYAPWSGMVALWQFSQSYWWNGAGRCDASYFFGERAALALWGKPGAPPPPPPDLPTGPVYVVRVQGGDGTSTYLRVSPRLDAAQGDRVTNGELLDATSALTPQWTTHFRAVKHRATGHLGYVYAGNVALP